MSEKREPYITTAMTHERKTELLFLSKRLKDIATEIDKLNQEEKTFIVEKADSEAPMEMEELYNALLEYLS